MKQGAATDVYGAGRGLDIIPAEHIQLVLGAPSYVVHHGSALRDGIGDEPLLVKYRIASRNEQNGNYIVTAFLGVNFPHRQFYKRRFSCDHHDDHRLWQRLGIVIHPVRLPGFTTAAGGG